MLGEAKEAFSTRQPKGEITLLIEGKASKTIESPSETQLENELRELISEGHSLSMVLSHFNLPAILILSIYSMQRNFMFDMYYFCGSS